MIGELNDVRNKEEPMKEYPMTHNPRGRALIFNHSKYDSEDVKERKGTNADRDRLKNILEKLHFLTEVCEDFTQEQIQDKFSKVSQENHTDYDCLVVAVMTHGTEIQIQEKERLPELHASDKPYLDYKLWEPFSNRNCPTLKGKPKLFFIQACRGSRSEEALKVDTPKAPEESVDEIYEDSSSETVSDPFELPDLYVARACSTGCVSFRSKKRGSYFIRTLCEELEEDLKKKNKEKDDVEEILRKVQQKVSYEEIKINKKQMPWVKSHLRKLLYFKNLNSAEE